MEEPAVGVNTDAPGARVLRLVQRLEQLHPSLCVLVAVDCGSRLWGTATPGVSDFDVKLVYARKLAWYLSLEPVDARPNTLQLNVKDDIVASVIAADADSAELDVELWDVRKLLQLAAKSNCSAVEWIRSPRILYQAEHVREPWTFVRECVLQHCSQQRLCMHYASLGGSEVRTYLAGRRTVPYKAYLYALRPHVCAAWLLQCGSAAAAASSRLPPLNVAEALHALPSVPPPVRAKLGAWLDAKALTRDIGEGNHDLAVDQWFEAIRRQAKEASRAAVWDTDATTPLTADMLHTAYWKLIGAPLL